MSEDHGHRFAVYSPSGVHIGLWADALIASKVQSESPGNTIEELVTLDLAQAMVAAAYDQGAMSVWQALDYSHKPNAEKLQAPLEARSALNAALAKAREDALREAARACEKLRKEAEGEPYSWWPNTCKKAILALIPTAEGEA